MNSSLKVFGIIKGFRRGGGRQYNDHVLVQLLADVKTVGSLVGAKIRVVDKYGNIYNGRIVKIHSFRNSVAIAKFSRNLPGQAIGALTEIVKR
ncbi:MAG: 50S ribosomal protein L35ae [Ignisphaera sp.]